VSNRDTLVQANYHLNKRIEEMMDQMDAIRSAGDTISRKYQEFEMMKNKLIDIQETLKDYKPGTAGFKHPYNCNQIINKIRKICDGKGSDKKTRT